MSDIELNIYHGFSGETLVYEVCTFDSESNQKICCKIFTDNEALCPDNCCTSNTYLLNNFIELLSNLLKYLKLSRYCDFEVTNVCVP